MEEIDKPPEDDIGFQEALGEEVNNPPEPKYAGDTLITRTCFDCDGLGEVQVKDETRSCMKCGGSGQIEHIWKVSDCETRIMGQFEQYLLIEAKKQISEIEAEYGPEEAGNYRTALMASRSAGHYKWDGKASRQARSDIPGLRYLFFLLLRRCQPTISEQLSDKIFATHMAEAGASIRWACNVGNVRGSVKRKTLTQEREKSQT